MRRTLKSTIGRKDVIKLIIQHIKETSAHFKQDGWDLRWDLIQADIYYDILKLFGLPKGELFMFALEVSKEFPIEVAIKDDGTIVLRKLKRKKKK